MLKVYSIRNFYSSTDFDILITEDELDIHPELVEAYVSQSSNWNKDWGTPKGFYAFLHEDATIKPEISIAYNKECRRYDWEFNLTVWFPAGQNERHSFIACGYNAAYLEAATEAQAELDSWMDQFDWK